MNTPDAIEYCRNRARDIFYRMGLEISEVERQINLMLGRYQEPRRKYHTLGHLKNGFELLSEFAQDDMTLTELVFLLVELGFLWHDMDSDEDTSAVFAIQQMRIWRCQQSYIDTVAAIILATKHNRMLIDFGQQLIADVDLTPLGASWETFELHSKWIEEESGLQGEAFRMRRREKLLPIFERTEVYYLPYFRKRFGMQAKENLGRFLAST